MIFLIKIIQSSNDIVSCSSAYSRQRRDSDACAIPLKAGQRRRTDKVILSVSWLLGSQ
jgi:hypothetical protein